MTQDQLRAQEHAELRKKEVDDAKKKALTRGVPYYICRGWLCAMDGSMAPRKPTEVEQIFWDALAVMG